MNKFSNGIVKSIWHIDMVRSPIKFDPNFIKPNGLLEFMHVVNFINGVIWSEMKKREIFVYALNSHWMK